MYNGCFRSGVFPKRWKRAKLVPIIKPGKENSEEVSKFHPISLLNIGGKVLEKVLINTINYYVYCYNLINNNLYGFTPHRSTVDAAMGVKDFIEGLRAWEVLVILNLVVKGAFDAAW
jgi:hypothetical protein